MRARALDLSESGHVLAAGSSEGGNETSDSTKGGEFPDHMNYAPLRWLDQGCVHFLSTYEPPRNSRREACDTKQVPYGGSLNIRRQYTKLTHRGDRSPGETSITDLDSLSIYNERFIIMHSELFILDKPTYSRV
jgi:hypothetical protein